MKNLSIIPILLIVLFIGCQTPESNNSEIERLKSENDSLRNIVSSNNRDSIYNSKLIKAIRENDSTAFFDASQYMMEQGKYSELFFYAFLMFMEQNDFQGAMITVFILNTFSDNNQYDSHKLKMFKKYIIAKMNEMQGKSYIPELIKDSNGNILSSDYFLDQMKKDTN